MSMKVSLIGAPTDVGAGIRGAHMGPGALRAAGLLHRLRHFTNDVIDCGDLLGPSNPEQVSAHGYRHLDEVTTWNAAVYKEVYTEVHAGRIPVVLGGDHSLGIGSVRAVAQYCRDMARNIRILWFDAHADFNTATSSPSANIHGMPVACLCGEGPDALIRVGGGAVPAVTPSEFRLIGVRSVDNDEKSRVHAAHLPIFDMPVIDQQGVETVMESALEGIDDNTHIHVSFDIDALDPGLAPGVSTPVYGGLGYREARVCLERIARTGCLGSVDIVELNPARDHGNATAEMVVSLITSLFGERILEPHPKSLQK